MFEKFSHFIFTNISFAPLSSLYGTPILHVIRFYTVSYIYLILFYVFSTILSLYILILVFSASPFSSSLILSMACHILLLISSTDTLTSIIIVFNSKISN